MVKPEEKAAIVPAKIKENWHLWYLVSSALEEKYISIGDNTHGKEAVQDIYEIPIRRCNKTYNRISRLAKNVMGD